MSPSPRSPLTILILLLLGCHCVTSLDRCLPQHHQPRDTEARTVNEYFAVTGEGPNYQL